MKKNSIVLFSVVSALTVVGATFAIGIKNVSNKNIDSVHATDLPKNLDLNSYTTSEKRSYYSNLNSLSSSERRGTNLLKNLKPILSNNMQWFSYDQVWNVYEITDRNWELSPASSTTYGTYNASTNTISNYVYYSALSTPKNNPYIHMLYSSGNDSTDTAIRIQTTSPTHGRDGGIDREHLWSQSIGFQGSSGPEGPAGTDVHHLVAAEHTVNSTAHSNYCYGDVTTNDSKWQEIIDERPLINQNKRCEVTATDGTKKSTFIFEPQDCDKGDVARALFYMAARYNNYANKSGAISDYDPYLALNNTIYSDRTGFHTTDTQPAYYGCLNTLLAWNKLDPPDEYEIYRNDLIMRNFQYNRNPFIDFPQWADMIWGTDTSSADPTTDTIYSPEPIGTLTSISITNPPSKTSYVVGENFVSTGIEVIASYSDKADTNVTNKCTYSPTTFANAGTQDVTVSYKENGITKTATVEVTVSPAELSSIKVTTKPTKLQYYVGQTVDLTGLVVTATYNNGFTKDVTNEITYSPSVLNVAGSRFVNISYTDNGITKKTSYQVTVLTPSIVSIKVTTLPSKLDYILNDTLDTTGLVVTGTYDSGDTADVTSDCTFSPTTLDTAGKQYITVTYSNTEITTQFYVTVRNAGPNSYIDDTYTLASNVANGKYLFGAEFDVENVHKYYCLSAQTIENSSSSASTKDLTELTSLNPTIIDNTETLTTAPFTLDFYEGKVSIDSTTKYLKASSDTSTGLTVVTKQKVLEDDENPHYFTLVSSQKRLGKDDATGTILKGVGMTRGVVIKKDTLKVGNYSSSNLTGDNYIAFRFYKVESTTINFLKDKLQIMTCSEMADKTYHDRLEYLHDNLTAGELNTLASTEITCSDGKTYNAEFAYNYAMSRYTVLNNISFIFNNTGYDIAELSVVILSIISFISIALVITKRHRYN